MKKWILNIVLLSIIAALIVGCATFGATDTSTNPNKDGNNIENLAQKQEENIDNDKTVDEDDKDEEETDLDVETDEDEVSKEEKDSAAGNEGVEKENDKGPKNESNSDKVKIHYSGDGGKKLVALTFDDGPESKHTPQILDILDEHNIKATFFVIGQNAARNTDILKDIHNRGHEIGSHSWSHKYLPKISKEAKKSEILKVEDRLNDILGEYTPIFRPPYGAVKDQEKQLLASMGYTIVNWSVDTKDWAGTSSDQMMKYVKDQLKPGGIILMHNTGNIETVPNLIKTLPAMIDWITVQGYEFVTVTEILN